MLVKAPLQIYNAGLIFSPAQSLFRKSFRSHAYDGLEVKTQLLNEWNACIQTLEGHSSWVNSVVFSPDGSRVASGSGDNTVRVWDVQTGQCEFTLEGHSGGVISVVFSPDGSRVASGSGDNTVRVWDIASITEIFSYNCEFYDQIKFDNDGATIVVNGVSLSIPSQTLLPCNTLGSLKSQSDERVNRLGIHNDWVILSSEKILWLPPEYRPGTFACYQNTIVVGSGTGRVTFVRYVATLS